jgi:sugar phosphate isomerase/epimerase
MMLGTIPFHLTYSTAVHGAERWAEARSMLDRYVLPIRNRVARGRRFGLGLHLSGRAVMDLGEPRALAQLRDWLDRHDAYLFTLNGAAYGRFQDLPVKTAIYRPDWLDEERLRHTDRLAHLLAALLPPRCDGTIGTVAGAYRMRVRSRIDDAAIADRLLRHVSVLIGLQQRTGKTIALALEPEPSCRLETIGETVEFFDRHLHSRSAVARVAALSGLDPGTAADAIRRHLGVCLDASHVALEFEEPATALRALVFAGIPVLKVQLASALRLRSPLDRHAREVLRPLANDAHLHAVVARTPGRLRRFVDLPLALAAPPPDADEWRVGAHVPLTADPNGAIGTTQRELTGLLTALQRTPIVHHLEVEVDTWSGIPIVSRNHDVVDVIVRDLEWALGALTDVAKTA